MKRLLLPLAAAFISIGLAGCPNTIGLPSIFQTIENPVKPINVYQTKLLYTATLQLSDDYRVYCYKKSYKEILNDPVMRPVCQTRRAVLRNIKKYQPLAGTAVRKAETFVNNNPTLDPFTVVSEAWKAVSQFESVLPSRSSIPVGG